MPLCAAPHCSLEAKVAVFLGFPVSRQRGVAGSSPVSQFRRYPRPPAAPAEESLCEKLLRLTGVDVTVCPACGEGSMGVIAELDKHDAATARIEILDSS